MRRIVLASLLTVFCLAGVARLNPFCLLEPDSPDYLFSSRSLATLQGYREIDHPDRPLHSFRPPGLPLLLAPVSWVRPYDVIGAKMLILGITVVVLGLAFILARRGGGPAAALAVVLLLAGSPYTLLHGTEVVTEAPFIAAVLGVLLLCSAAEEGSGHRRLLLAGLLLAFVPFLRTIGVALIGAVGVWGLTARTRLRWSVVAGASLLPTALWTWRNARLDGPTYLGSVLGDLSALGVGGFTSKALGAAAGYVARLADVLLPGLRPGQPLYERVTYEPVPDLAAPLGLALPLALIVIVLAAIGMWRRRREEGGVALLYSLFFLAALAVYPPRHERLTWPLVPLVWVYVPAGYSYLTGRVQKGAARWVRAARAGSIVALIALTAWQGWHCVRMIRPNLHWATEGAGFYTERYPPFYYCDWQAAGRWIRDHSPPRARVLTRHSDLGFGARRFQDSLRFEELSPLDWRQRIASLGAVYLAVPTAGFGALFRWEALDGDPAYDYRVVYRERGVAVIEIAPDREGAAHHDPAFHRVREYEDQCRDALRLYPGRLVPLRRLAELLAARGAAEEAISLLRGALPRHGDEPGLHVTLGRTLLELERFDEAAAAFRRAAGLPEADALRRRIERGIERAREGSARVARNDPVEHAELLARRALRQMQLLDMTRAGWNLDAALALHGSSPLVQFAAGEWFRRQGAGSTSDAASYLERAAAQGYPPAAERLDLLRRETRVLHGAGPHPPAASLELALRLAGDGRPGQALEVLERAGEGHPGEAAVRLREADLWLFFGRPERAEPLYREVLEHDASNSGARRGLAACAAYVDAAF